MAPPNISVSIYDANALRFVTVAPTLAGHASGLTVDNASAGNTSRLYHGEVEYYTPILVHVFVGLYILFGVIIALFNTMTIVAIVKCPELKTITNMFVLSLSCADLILSPTLIFIHFLPHSLLTLGVAGTRIAALCLFTLMFTSSGASLLSILAIAVDRYVAVIHPYNYKQIMTPKRATILIALVWFYTTVFMTSLIAYYLWRTDPQVFFHMSTASAIIPLPVYLGAVVSQILVCIIASVALYVRIFIAIQQRHSHSISQRNRNPQVKNVQSRRITNTMALVLGALILSWTPYAVCSVTLTNEMFYRHPWLVYANMFSILLLYANSFMNPIIYAARSQAFRKAYTKQVCCRCVATTTPVYMNVDTPTTVSVKSTKESLTEATAVTTHNGRSDTTEI